VAKKTVDWTAEAVNMANYVDQNMFEAHRGAMRWKQTGVTVIFGNDGFALPPKSCKDRRTEYEVSAVREYLSVEGVPILGFGVSDGNASWAMLVKTDDVDTMNRLVWACWMPDRPVREIMADNKSENPLTAALELYQGTIARKVIRKFAPKRK
jgi:hypothetical protein